MVEGEPAVSGGPDAVRWWCRVPRAPVPGGQELLFAGPAGSSPARTWADVVIRACVSMGTWDHRKPLLGDVLRIASLAFGLTTYGPIPEALGAVFVGGRDTDANRKRWWAGRAFSAQARCHHQRPDRRVRRARERRSRRRRRRAPGSSGLVAGHGRLESLAAVWSAVASGPHRRSARPARRGRSGRALLGAGADAGRLRVAAELLAPGRAREARARSWRSPAGAVKRTGARSLRRLARLDNARRGICGAGC